MNERPILFSAPMVLACLREVDPKTQTRRALKPAPLDNPPGGPLISFNQGTAEYSFGLNDVGPHRGWWRCPYGQPGDVLWVRETLRRSEVGPWVYRADDVSVAMMQGDPRIPEMVAWAHHKEGDTCVSIHMPRWACRLRLRITDVRVERLIDISPADAIAEGLVAETIEFPDGVERSSWSGVSGSAYAYGPNGEGPRQAYFDLWNSINGPDADFANPWVWAITFEVQR